MKQEFPMNMYAELKYRWSEEMFRSLDAYPNLDTQDGSGEHLAALGPQCCAFRDGAYSLNSDTILLALAGE
jgi:hypothetical protein